MGMGIGAGVGPRKRGKEPETALAGLKEETISECFRREWRIKDLMQEGRQDADAENDHPPEKSPSPLARKQGGQSGPRVEKGREHTPRSSETIRPKKTGPKKPNHPSEIKTTNDEEKKGEERRETHPDWSSKLEREAPRCQARAAPPPPFSHAVAEPLPEPEPDERVLVEAVGGVLVLLEGVGMEPGVVRVVGAVVGGRIGLGVSVAGVEGAGVGVAAGLAGVAVVAPAAQVGVGGVRPSTSASYRACVAAAATVRGGLDAGEEAVGERRLQLSLAMNKRAWVDVSLATQMQTMMMMHKKKKYQLAAVCIPGGGHENIEDADTEAAICGQPLGNRMQIPAGDLRRHRASPARWFTLDFCTVPFVSVAHLVAVYIVGPRAIQLPGRKCWVGRSMKVGWELRLEIVPAGKRVEDPLANRIGTWTSGESLRELRETFLAGERARLRGAVAQPLGLGGKTHGGPGTPTPQIQIEEER
ncbi:hypothetical protein DFH09DRAFT_1409363 [Mycena vulgaris]|nr:hypothetical protein DFH09DRAFT_1409363 [Mycena vulgaris]